MDIHNRKFIGLHSLLTAECGEHHTLMGLSIDNNLSQNIGLDFSWIIVGFIFGYQ